LRVPKDEGFSPEELLAAVAIFAVGIGVHAVVVNAPEMKRRWSDNVFPAIKSKWNTVFRAREAESPAAVPDDESTDTAPARS
jgi:hypothetical protein